MEPECSPDFDFPPRGSVTKSDTSEYSENAKKVKLFEIDIVRILRATDEYEGGGFVLILVEF